MAQQLAFKLPDGPEPGAGKSAQDNLLETARRALDEGAWLFVATQHGWVVQAGGEIYRLTPSNGGWACTCPESAGARNQGLDCAHIHGLRLRQAQITVQRRTGPTDLKPALLIRDYVCSDCWGHLVEFIDPKTRESHIRCTTEGCECSGYVSKRFVERRQAESAAERIAAREALRDAVPWLKAPKKSTQQLLNELGY